MYTIKKRMEIAGSHKLKLNYESPCQRLHGHNWIVTVFCKTKDLDENGMVIDFTKIKKMVHNKLDHQHLNDVVEFNPTAENIAKWIVDQISSCYKAIVQESEGNEAIYEIED